MFFIGLEDSTYLLKGIEEPRLKTLYTFTSLPHKSMPQNSNLFILPLIDGLDDPSYQSFLETAAANSTKNGMIHNTNYKER